MTGRKQGDQIGELDEDGIAQWYPKCKVRKEGDVYIATPHTTNPARRKKHVEKTITVAVQEDGKYTLADKPVCKPVERKQMTVEETIEAHEKSPPEATDEPKKRQVTLKQVFDELYAKYSELKPQKRKEAILSAIRPLFQNEDAAKYFVDEQWRRKRRNAYTRRQRFEYKANNQNYEYFFTLTYDDKKHTEQSFEKSLKSALSNLHKRHGCLFQGVWERGDENGRLHFHGLMYDPNGKIKSGLEEVSDYNPKTGRKKTYLRSKYFMEKFGRNEFSSLIPQIYFSAVRYITKYLSKHDVKPYYSQGLYRFIESDISGTDVLGLMDSSEDGRDIRLLVAGDFTIWQDGVKVGEVSPETIAQATKLP